MAAPVQSYGPHDIDGEEAGELACLLLGDSGLRAGDARVVDKAGKRAICRDGVFKQHLDGGWIADVALDSLGSASGLTDDRDHGGGLGVADVVDRDGVAEAGELAGYGGADAAAGAGHEDHAGW